MRRNMGGVHRSGSVAPATYILCSFLTLFAIALTPSGRWWTLAFYSLLVLWPFIGHQQAWHSLFKRLRGEWIFLFLLLLIPLGPGQGEIIWQAGIFQIRDQALVILVTLIWKGLLSLVLLHHLLWQFSQGQILQTLLSLGVPYLLVGIMASMLRYLELIVRESQILYQAARSRNLLTHPGRARLLVASLFGHLFVRTYSRGERIHQAMLARGYQGLKPPPQATQWLLTDYGLLGATLLCLGLGQML